MFKSALGGLVALLCLSVPAQAVPVTATITGVVDGTQAAFKAVFVYDLDSFDKGGTIYGGSDFGTSDPMLSAAMTIGGKSYNGDSDLYTVLAASAGIPGSNNSYVFDVAAGDGVWFGFAIYSALLDGFTGNLETATAINIAGEVFGYGDFSSAEGYFTLAPDSLVIEPFAPSAEQIPSPVPLPASLPLLLTGVVWLGRGYRKRPRCGDGDRQR